MHRRPFLAAIASLALVASACVTVTPGGASPSFSASPSVSPSPVISASPSSTRPPDRSPTITAAPSATPTPVSATATPTVPPPTAPTDAPTAVPTGAPTAGATLDFSLPAVHGSTDLTSGYVPDPFTIDFTSGGPADAGYVGSGCTGFTSVAPSFSVNYTSGSFPLLRFYFVAPADTTMVVNTPTGSYVCEDDSFETLDPTIDFDNPSSGRYDVWIGSFEAGGSTAGTLSVTENNANHP